MKNISMLALLVAFASAYYYVPMKKPIPAKYCIVKNCHNCARSFNFNFGTRASRTICTAMYHQAAATFKSNEARESFSKSHNEIKTAGK